MVSPVVIGALLGSSRAAQGFGQERDLRRKFDREMAGEDYRSRLGLMNQDIEQRMKQEDPLYQTNLKNAQAQGGLIAAQTTATQALGVQRGNELTDELKRRNEELQLQEQQIALGKRELKLQEDLLKLKSKNDEAELGLKGDKAKASVELRERYNRLLEIAAAGTGSPDYVEALGSLGRWTNKNLALLKGDPLYESEVEAVVQVRTKPEEVEARATARVGGLGIAPPAPGIDPEAHEEVKGQIEPPRSPYLGALGVMDAGQALDPLVAGTRATVVAPGDSGSLGLPRRVAAPAAGSAAVVIGPRSEQEITRRMNLYRKTRQQIIDEATRLGLDLTQ